MVVPLDAAGQSDSKYATSTIRRPVDGSVDVEVRPLDSGVLYHKNKTYLLIELSGQFDESLCEWLVEHGAGHLYMISRHPIVDLKWLDSFSATDAVVKTVALDVLDQCAIQRVVNQIRTTSPPIAGILYAAMIMDDRLFSNVSAESMCKVLGPKMTGTKNLDDVFHNDDLDFFVLFSFATAGYGNAGQSAYCAANEFLNGIARERRSRCLAASATGVGRVAGIGYAEAAVQAVQNQLKKNFVSCRFQRLICARPKAKSFSLVILELTMRNRSAMPLSLLVSARFKTVSRQRVHGFEALLSRISTRKAPARHWFHLHLMAFRHSGAENSSVTPLAQTRQPVS